MSASRQVIPDGDSLQPLEQGHRPATRTRRALRAAFLVAVVAIAVFFRVVGHRWPADAIDRPGNVVEEWVSWDQHQHLHPDERFQSLVATAIQLPSSLGEYLNTESSPANPHNAGYNFYPYGTWPMIATRAVAELLGREDYDRLTVVGRLLSAAADVLTLLLVYLLGRRLTDRTTAVVAAGLYACCVLSIQHARFWTVESMGTCLVTFTVLCCTLVARHGRWRWWLLAGLGVGAATATKISLWLVAGLVPLAALIHLRREAVEEGTDRAETRRFLRPVLGVAAAGIVAAVTFRLLLPYAFTGMNPLHLNPVFLDNLAELSRLMNGAADFPPALQWTDRTPYLYPLRNLFFWGLGPTLAIAAGAGWLAALSALTGSARRTMAAAAGYAAILAAAGWWGLLGGAAVPIVAAVFSWLWAAAVTVTGARNRLLLALPVGFLATALASQGVQFVKPMRYLLPICPLLCLLAAAALMSLTRSPRQAAGVEAGRRRAAARLAGLAVAAAVVGATAVWAWGFSSIYRRPDTRIEASAWIFDQLPPAVSAELATDRSTWTVPVEIPGPTLLDRSRSTVSGRLRSAVPGTLQAVQLLVGRPPVPPPSAATLEVELSGEIGVLARGSAVISTDVAAAGAVETARVPSSRVDIDPGRAYTVTVRLADGGPVLLETSTVAVEEWDDALPVRLDGRDGFQMYRGLTLPTYADDGADKLDTIVDILDRADIVVVSSQRGPASVRRLPRRYPLQNRFYELLVNGSLGYDLAGHWTSWPRLGSRWLPDQEVVARWPPQLASRIDLPPAEEPFSVYDHPRIFIFRRSERFDRGQARALLGDRVRPTRHLSPRRATALAWEQRMRRLPGVGQWLARRLQSRSERIETPR